MPQDFVRKKSPGKSKKKVPRKTSRSATRVQTQSDTHWSWFMAGLMFGLFGSFIIYLSFIRTAEIEDTKGMISNETNIDAPTENRDEFDFYNYLTDAEVQVEVVQVEERAPPEEDTVQYLLQAGSFQNRLDADGQRANVILLNLDARVVPGVVGGKTWYRVQVGPFTGRSAADEAMDVLLANNMDPLLLKLR